MGYKMWGTTGHIEVPDEKYTEREFSQVTPNKYDDMIYEEQESQVAKDSMIDKKIIEDVILCNFITIWNKSGQSKECKCRCGEMEEGTLKIKYHTDYKYLSEIEINGLKCSACNRMYAVRTDVIKAVKRNKYFMGVIRFC